MQRTPPPKPKANLGDLITVLVDQDRGAYEPDTVITVNILCSKANGWRVAYQCKHHEDFNFEGAHVGQVVKSAGRQWHQLPEPRFWIDELVSFKYNFREWTAGVIDEITMEFNGIRWEIEYWFRGMDAMVKEGQIGKVIERHFEPPRMGDEITKLTNDGESEIDI